MTANKNLERKKHSDRIGIKWKMFALLVLLTAISILIVWIFLIQMANHFYQRTKFRELNFSDTAIASALGKSSEDLNNTVDMCSDEYSTDIWIYEIKAFSNQYLSRMT